MPSQRENDLSASSWIVLKFGGTSVSSLPRWQKIATIAKQWQARGKRVVIVVSALSGITDKLKAITEARDAERRHQIRDEIIARHQAMFAELALSDHGPIQYWLERLRALVDNTRADAGALPWQAEVLALGELMSSTLGVFELHRRRHALARRARTSARATDAEPERVGALSFRLGADGA